MEKYNSLLNKLDIFIKKYYKNKLLKGVFISISMLLTAYTFISLTEYYAHLSISLRTFIFYSFLATLGTVSLVYIFLPVLNLFKIGKIISYKQASEIISSHFKEIEDKLLNTLELHEQNKLQYSVLVEAGINQKINNLKVFSFPNAINYKENYKYLKFLLPILILFIGIFVFFPKIFKESNERLVNYNQFYQKPLPFNFNMLNDTLTVKKGDDFTIKLNISGEYIPNEVFITFSGNSFIMKKESKTEFSYTFKNVNNSLDFNFEADTYDSQNFEIQVLPAPVVIDFSLFADVPEYTGEQDRAYSNTGDIIVPFGTKLNWKFKTTDIDSLSFTDDSKKVFYGLKEENIFSINQTMYNDFHYKINVMNNFFSIDNMVDYRITVVPDLYPSIIVSTLQDSSNFFVSYFNGQIGDDYGIKTVNLKYRTVPVETTTEDKSIPYKTINIPLESNHLKQQFYYVIDFSKIETGDENSVQYYFEVWDNDGVSGSKSSRTHVNSFNIPTYEEKNEASNQANENIASKMQQSVSLANQIKSEISELKEKTASGESSEWQINQMLQSITEKQSKLEELLKEASQENEAKNEMQENLSPQQLDLLEKQKQLQELMENVMTDELKELMKQIEELRQKFDKEKLNELTEKMEMSMDDMQKELDRNMELMKRYEVEQKIDDAINELNKLSEKQENLSEETLDKNSNKENISDKQEDIQERFEQIKEEYKKTLDKNEELKDPMKLEDFEELSKEIESEFNETKEQLGKKKESKASDSQKKNSENMKKMAEQMQSMMDGNSEEQAGEDEAVLRQILDNLISFSFRQEELMNNLKQINPDDPQFIDVSKKQLNIKEDFSIIEDSLRALASRVFQINSTVTKEISEINTNIKYVIDDLQEYKKNNAQKRQQEVMTSSNKLALLLNEILDNMQNQQSGGEGSGKKQCKNPKSSGKPSFADLKKQQEAMKKSMEKMLEQMKKGNEGKNGEDGKKQLNKQLAQQLAQQEIFKQMMQEMMSKTNLNSKSQKMMNEINKMIEQTETELVNKKITPELLKRQQEITTRLLEAEKAENEREQENKRESHQADEQQYKSPEDYFKKKNANTGFDEDLFYNNLKITNFYKNLYEKYSETISK